MHFYFIFSSMYVFMYAFIFLFFLSKEMVDLSSQNTFISMAFYKMCPWSTKAVISNTGIFVAIDNNTLYGSKLLIFILCQKSLGY